MQQKLLCYECSASISEYLIRASSEHERTKNETFELRASTNAQFSERERASIERFDVRHNTNDKQPKNQKDRLTGALVEESFY